MSDFLPANQSLDCCPAPLAQRGALMLCLLAALSACGGGNNTNSTPNASGSAAPGALATGSTVFGVDGAAAQSSASVIVQPSYHLSPVMPESPDLIDSDGNSLSATLPPQSTDIPASAIRMRTSRLTVDLLSLGQTSSSATPSAATQTSATYRPAQIRAAYGMPPVPASMTGLTAAQAAQLGAGQTVYIVDAYDDPMAFGELSAFNQLFGLPACTAKTLAATSTLPLPAPTANGCDFYQVYSTGSGTLAAKAPAYDPNWAVEIALDVQWVHATAPLSRIVLIESADASLNGLGAAVQLANNMGPGVVSMSFGGSEGSYVTAFDYLFKQTGMTYFAATGDNGSGVSWPAVSPGVVAVGGTSLTYSGTGTRSEITWAGTGGGISAYEPTPSYQNTTVPGLTPLGHRSVADVAFNADPNTGQFVAVISNQTTCSFCQVSWVTAGGTSLATPQWAGLTAVSNAIRVQAGKTMLGDIHGALYSQAASSAAVYAADFADITAGGDGSCATCQAKKGYDIPTGLGTPNAAALTTALTGLANPVMPPVVTGAGINGTVGQALTFTASVTDSNPYTLSLSGAPNGMTIASTGIVSWATPVAGSYPVTVTAKDSKTGLSGSGVYAITIYPPPAPVVSSASVSGTAGIALTFTATVSDSNPYTLTLSAAPAGMTISATGVVNWAAPVAGTYAITVTAKDSKTGLTGKGVTTLSISPAAAPVVGSGNVTGKPGAALSFVVAIKDSNPYTLTLKNAPTGMQISSIGVVSWANPVAGNYTVTIIAKDSKTGVSGQGVYNIAVGSATGPAITGTGLTGVAGKALSGMISISDASASIVGVGIGGAPLTMSFSPVGGINNIAINWPSPVTGTYTLQVMATDSAGHSTQTSLTLTITSH